MNRLLSVEQTAELMGVSVHTVRAWVFGRKITYYKLGRQVLISPESLEKMLAESEQPRVHGS